MPMATGGRVEDWRSWKLLHVPWSPPCCPFRMSATISSENSASKPSLRPFFLGYSSIHSPNRGDFCTEGDCRSEDDKSAVEEWGRGMKDIAAVLGENRGRILCTVSLCVQCSVPPFPLFPLLFARDSEVSSQATSPHFSSVVSDVHLMTWQMSIGTVPPVTMLLEWSPIKKVPA